MNIFWLLFLGFSTYGAGWASEGEPYPVLVTDGGRDIHYFTTSGWVGLREGVAVARGMPLALTCDFRDKVRRVAGPDGVMRSEVVTNTTSVNITFPLSAGQEVHYISPSVNKFKGAWETYRPEATVFFPSVVAYTEVQCNAAYVEDGKEHVSIIKISVTPHDGVTIWKHAEYMKGVSEVECKAYDLLGSRLKRFSRELYQVVSLMLADDNVLTTVPRTAIRLPFTGVALSRIAMLKRTEERLNVSSTAVNRNITCVVYHVHRPEWGVYVTSYVKKKRLPWWILTLILSSVAFVMIFCLVALASKRRVSSTLSMYGQL
ncbi:hypothetical protein E2C01_080430 [Portunus trituberculatus]|uniref:Uncharacterized protein n=1 Tax=Portunus trituberculatus TaxID=210409 RepID=A0A5B7IYE3_PORTR|nr:hypothetical protein [Portunus trituberculatus]